MGSSVIVSVLSICFLVLSIYQAFHGRFFAWPCLACWMSGRFLEVMYLALILSAVGPEREPDRHGTGSFAESNSEDTSETAEAPAFASGLLVSAAASITTPMQVPGNE